MEAGTYEQAVVARDFIAAKTSLAPRIGIVLGSGLGRFADQLSWTTTIPYKDIPHFPRATVEGHKGQLLIGTVSGIEVAVMQGRVHGYEGYSAAETVFPVRVLGLLGIKTLIVTNAAGGIRTSYQKGQIVSISDHINFTGLNPLAGPNDRRLGVRFPDMTDAYSKRLRSQALEAARFLGFDLHEGVYLGLHGPNYETPAEIRAFRTLGADLVGMSTVHEVLVARHMGIDVLGISCVTNMAAGVLDQKLDHEEVMEIGERVQTRFAALLTTLVPRI
jgi:purine-nucleoside phosphorylase